MLYSRWWLAGLTSLLLAGCQQAPAPNGGKVTPPPETTPQQKQLAQSLETWQALKLENGNYYRYDTSFASFFGFGNTTTLTVQDEQVIVRAYRSYATNEDGEPEAAESWTEEGAAVGSHEAGAEPRTVDELYSVCRSEVLPQNPLENELCLEFRDDGVLKTCEYFPKSCADDCFMGVNITDLEFPPFGDDSED